MERGRKNHSASSAPPRFHFLQTLSQKATPNNHRYRFLQSCLQSAQTPKYRFSSSNSVVNCPKARANKGQFTGRNRICLIGLRGNADRVESGIRKLAV